MTHVFGYYTTENGREEVTDPQRWMEIMKKHPESMRFVGVSPLPPAPRATVRRGLNCVNCGAPALASTCDYCGTVHGHRETTGMPLAGALYGYKVLQPELLLSIKP